MAGQIATGKHELRIHIPHRTYNYLKTHAEGRQLGQLVADAVDVYATQAKVARQIDVMSRQMEEMLTILEEKR